MTNIAGLKRPGGKSTFVPNKVMLHKQDTTMILSDPLNPHSLYRLDLETGRVVDEWKIGDSISVNNFVPDSKTAQTTGEDTFVGTSHNSIFRIDPRLAGNKLVDSQHREYKTKVDFTSAVTTGEGKLAVATNKGEIKLFDRLGINAKTSLPNLGHAITGIDVTGDGRYIVATTKERLLFIDTKIHEGKNMGLSACESFAVMFLRFARDADYCVAQSTSLSQPTQSHIRIHFASDQNMPLTLKEASTSRLLSSTSARDWSARLSHRPAPISSPGTLGQ